jgi:hypothetical protein
MCSMCIVREGPVYPYRCTKCGLCLCCQHWRIGYRFWLGFCGLARTTFQPGSPVRPTLTDVTFKGF